MDSGGEQTWSDGRTPWPSPAVSSSAIRIPRRAPGAFYSMAQAHLEQRRLAEAEACPDRTDRPVPRSRPAGPVFLSPRLRSDRCRRLSPEARTDFEACGTAEAGRPLAINAGLWHALTWFFERDYALPWTNWSPAAPGRGSSSCIPKSTTESAPPPMPSGISPGPKRN